MQKRGVFKPLAKFRGVNTPLLGVVQPHSIFYTPLIQLPKTAKKCVKWKKSHPLEFFRDVRKMHTSGSSLYIVPIKNDVIQYK